MNMNSNFINLLEKIEYIYKCNSEAFKAKATSTAIESIRKLDVELTDVKQLDGLKGAGKSIKTRFKEFQDTGTIKFVEDELTKPFYSFTEIYGVGPKKAKELSDKFTSIEELKNSPQDLNAKQTIGLKYYEDIKQRIPRNVIETYDSKFKDIFKNFLDLKYEIVGSYRRGSSDSGDIDVIFTSDNLQIFDKIIETLKKENIIKETLSKGKHKSMTICKINEESTGRRVDFMITSKEDYPFAILYFTGNKDFNVKMREHAKKIGYTLNEYKFKDVEKIFSSERDIFEYLKLSYVEPSKRNATSF